MPDVGIRIDGLREFRASLKQLEDKLPRELTKANKTAAEFLATKARRAAESQGSVAAHVAESIKATGGQLGGFIVGGAGHPEFFGAEFGAKAYAQFKAWLGNGEEAGYFLFKAVRDNEEQVVDIYGDMIDALAKRAFPT